MTHPNCRCVVFPWHALQDELKRVEIMRVRLLPYAVSDSKFLFFEFLMRRAVAMGSVADQDRDLGMAQMALASLRRFSECNTK